MFFILHSFSKVAISKSTWINLKSTFPEFLLFQIASKFDCSIGFLNSFFYDHQILKRGIYKLFKKTKNLSFFITDSIKSGFLKRLIILFYLSRDYLNVFFRIAKYVASNIDYFNKYYYKSKLKKEWSFLINCFLLNFYVNKLK